MRLSERARLGRSLVPELTYRPRPSFGGLAADLAGALLRLDESAVLESLYAARIRELQLELELVRAIGGRAFCGLAKRRFAAQGRELGQASELAEHWTRDAGACSESEPPVAIDEPAEPASVVSLLQRWIGSARLPFRVVVTDDLSAMAATGQGVVYVAADRVAPRQEALRVAVHEFWGHVLPRHRAGYQALGLFAAGSRGGNDEQEGLALYYEARAGLLGRRRRRELGARHLAAQQLFSGATFADVISTLRARDYEPREAIQVALRAFRGGGLGREFTYLPAFLRVGRALASEPALQAWLEAGRLSLDALSTLRAHFPALQPQSAPGSIEPLRCEATPTETETAGRFLESIGR